MHRSRPILVLALVACVSAGVATQQTVPPVTFKVDIDFVEVSAVVTDAQGRFVSTLGKDDFQILEDGRPQKVGNFSLVDIPIQSNPESSRLRSIEPDVANNAGGLQGRLYMIVLDDLHTDLVRTALVKAATHRFIERYLTDDDLAAVVMTSGRSEGAEDFTANRRRLLGAVDTFVGQKLRSVTLEKIDTYNTQRDLGQEPDTAPKLINDAFEIERGQRARNTLLTIRSLAEALSSVHGRRKAMVYIGEGIDYNTSNYEQWRELAGNARQGVNIEGALRDAITAAARANVSIYSIDPRGLTNLGDAGIEVSGFTNDPNARLDSRGFLEELQLSQDSLRVLAEQTGGVASVNTNDLPAAFDRVVRENSSYYMLGYTPSNGKRDGSFRRIEVKVNRPGLQVRARRGYAAPSRNETTSVRRGPKDEGSPELADALGRPIQTSGLTLHTSAVALKGTAPNTSAAVAITIDGPGFKFAEKDGWIEDKVEVSVRAIDEKATIRGSEHFDLNIRIRPESRRILNETGFRVLSQIDVPPGRYRLQVGARESGGGATGTVFTTLDVPDFVASPIGMSNLVVTSVNTGGLPTGRAERVSGRLPVLPSTIRDFRTADELTTFVEVYDNESRPHTIDITATILDSDGKTIVRHQEQRSSTELAANAGAFRYAAGIPLKEFRPGTYSLRVEASSRLAGEAKTARDVSFRVIP